MQACCEFKIYIFLEDETSDTRHEITLANMPHVFSGNRVKHIAGKRCYCLGLEVMLLENSVLLPKYSLKGRLSLLITVQED